MGFFDFIDEVAFTIGDAADWCIDTVKENPGKVLLVAGATVATGGAFFVAAPAIAATVGATGVLGATSAGTAISSLSGAALANASLAAIGGGSIAAGGGGMAAGTMVVTGVGATIGAGTATGAAVVASKVSQD